MLFGTGTKGGVYREKAWGCTGPTFLELFCLLWFVPTNRLPACRYRKIGEDDSAPPETGVPSGPDSGTEYRAAIRPQGVAIVGIYPCGKARKRTTTAVLRGGRKALVGSPFPSPRMIPNRFSPSRVSFAASRPGPLRTDLKGVAVYEGKGVDGPGCRVASGRVDGPKGNLSVIPAA